MINIWVGVSLIHSRPSTTSANRSGSASRSGRCGFIVSGVALRRRDRTGERAGHLAMKWRGSSGSEWQSLQVGLLGWLRSFLHRKRLASASSPSHPTRRRMRKLFLRVAWVSWRVTVQCGAGLPIGKSQSPRGYSSHWSSMVMYARMFRSRLIDRFQVSLLRGVLRSCLMEGRQSSSRRFPQVTVIPLALGFTTLASSSCLGRSLACMLMEFMKASCRWEM